MTTETLPAVWLAPIETVTPIKPSEAIRLGCLIAPVKCGGEFFGPNGEACALGAMALGFGFQRTSYQMLDGINAWWFVDRRLPRRLPESPDLLASDVIYMKNDSDDWPRERIADWLEGLGL